MGSMVGWIAVSALCSLPACVVSKASLGGDGAIADDGDDDDAAEDDDGSTTGGGGHTGPGGTAATEGATSGDGVALDIGGLGSACVSIDHDTCFTAVQSACYGNANWDADDDCVAAVLDCYSVGTEALATSDVIEFCSSELEEGCIEANGPGCGETFCECTAGVYPYDWTSCWHLLLIACSPEVDSDCAAVLGSCYPEATVPQYEACRDQVLATGEGECNCPTCDVHDACEASLDECLGG